MPSGNNVFTFSSTEDGCCYAMLQFADREEPSSMISQCICSPLGGANKMFHVLLDISKIKSL